MKFRVWFDPYYAKRTTEVEDGEEYEAVSPETAAQAFAKDRYAELQHVDPGMVLVRDLETSEVSRWAIAARVQFTAERQAPPLASDT